MIHLDDSIRAALSPDGQRLFDDIATQRILGASAHIRMIAQMIRDLCASAQAQGESAASLHAKIQQLCAYFNKTRGEASQAITNALKMMTNGSEAQLDRSLEVYIAWIDQKIDDFERTNKHNLELINQYAQCLLMKMNSVLLFDYSSTVGKMIETCDHPLEVYIPESRAFDGGKPYVSQAIRGHHKAHFIPDAAMYYFLKQCDAAFIGAETYYADGMAFNSVGSEMVAALCHLLNVSFYVLTTLIKIDIRSLYGYTKPTLLLNLREKLLPGVDPKIKEQVDYACPEIVEIPAKWISAYITEAGIVPPSAMYQLSTNYLREIGVLNGHA